MGIFGSLSDKANTAVKYAGFIMTAVMTVLIVIQVFFRYVLGSSLSWSEESARYLFIWIVMLGASMGVKEGFHVSVTLFINKLPAVLRRIVDTVFTLFLGVMALVMVIYGYSIANTVAIQVSPAIRLSMFWVYLSVPVSGVLIIIHLLSKIEENIRALKS